MYLIHISAEIDLKLLFICDLKLLSTNDLESLELTHDSVSSFSRFLSIITYKNLVYWRIHDIK